MENWTKRYYQTLLGGLIAFALILFFLGTKGASLPLLFLAFIVFYLAFKNGLQAWVKNQIAKEDPVFREKNREERAKKREMWKAYLLPRSPWYRNESIGVILLLLLAFFFGLR